MLLVPPMFLQSIYHSTNALRDKPFVTHINSYMFRHQCVIVRGVITTKVDFVSVCAFVKFYCSGPSLRILPPKPPNDLAKICTEVSDKVRRLISKQQIHVVLVRGSYYLGCVMPGAKFLRYIQPSSR
jgi:hypothetical protein